MMTLCLWTIVISGCAGSDENTNTIASATAPSITSKESRSPSSIDCYTMDADSCAGFSATNIARTANGSAPLVFCPTCYLMAYEQSRDMSDKGYFSHARTDETFSERVARFGLSNGVAENIAYGSVGAKAVDMWMNSSGHRANILNARYKSFAISTYKGYSTQVFYNGTDK